MMVEMWLDPIPATLRGDALAELDRGDAVGFLCKAGNEYGLDLIYFNEQALKKRDVYESALLHAFIGTRTNNARWSMRDLVYLFGSADRARLRAAGQPLPAPPFNLYRGVAGRGPARRVRSFSWTASPERALWFAKRFPGLHDPAIYTVTVGEADILEYVNDRQEQEFIVDLPASCRPVRFVACREKPAAKGK
jgi:hypothetical protein